MPPLTASARAWSARRLAFSWRPLVCVRRPFSARAGVGQPAAEFVGVEVEHHVAQPLGPERLKPPSHLAPLVLFERAAEPSAELPQQGRQALLEALLAPLLEALLAPLLAPLLEAL